MKKMAIFFVVAIIFFTTFIFFWLISPVTNGGACSCPTSFWMPGSVIMTSIHNLSVDLHVDCSRFGCALSYFVFPLDLLLIAMIFFIGGFWLYRRQIKYKNE